MDRDRRRCGCVSRREDRDADVARRPGTLRGLQLRRAPRAVTRIPSHVTLQLGDDWPRMLPP